MNNEWNLNYISQIEYYFESKINFEKKKKKNVPSAFFRMKFSKINGSERIF